ncbi:hypothetical protein SLA2020_055940 [Shorea laevis]
MTKRVSCLGFKNAVEPPTTNPLDFSDRDEAMQIGQQSLVGHISTFTGGKKSMLFKFLGVRGEDIENLAYFAEKSQEETIRITQQLENGDGPFAKLPCVKKSVDLMGLNTMDANGSLTLFDYSKEASEEAIRSTHSQCQHPVLPFRLDFSVPKKQRSNRGKATNTTSVSKIKKFGNSVLEDFKPRFFDHEKVGRKKSIVFKFLGVRDEDNENFLYFAKKTHEEAIRKWQESVDSIDVNGSLALFDFSMKANEEALRSTHSQCIVPPSRLDFSVPKKQRSNRGKATNTTGFSKIKKFGNYVLEDLKPKFFDHEKARHKKSIVLKFLGVSYEDTEDFLYFAKKTHEEAVRKRQESVDLMDVNGSLVLFDFSMKANEEALRSTHSQCIVSPCRLDFSVPKKQKSNRGKALISTYTTGFSNKFGKPVLKDLKPAEQVEHNRKCLKRCRESIEIEEKNKPKRQKDGKIQNKKGLARLAEWSLEPPPNMPIEFKKLIEEMGGSQEKLLIQKIIFKTDLSKTHNRLQIPMNQVMVTDFLTQDEARKLDGEEGLNVDLIEPCLKKSKIHLTKWSMGNSKVLVFNEQWKSVVDGNRTLKKNAVMQIWSFRTAPESNLCFAMVKVRDGDDD